jgi:hypothetical protein
MRWELPDVDLKSMSLEELKAYAGVCAAVENQFRAYVIGVHSEIIKRVNASFTTAPTRVKSNKVYAKVCRTKDLDNLEDLYSLEDFK